LNTIFVILSLTKIKDVSLHFYQLHGPMRKMLKQQILSFLYI